MIHLGRLFKYAPIRLEVESQSLLTDDESRNASLDINRAIAGKNGRGTWNGEKAKEAGIPLETLPAEGVLSQGKDKDGDMVKDVDADALPDLVAPPKRPTWKSSASSNSRTSRNMQAKQAEDAKAAADILARINKPADDERINQLEKALDKTMSRAGHILAPRRKDIERQMMDDPISKIILQHNDELETLDAEDRDKLISLAFTHPLLRQPRPFIWIPKDDFGISDDEVRRTRAFSRNLDIENRGAYFDRKLKVVVDQEPPDLDQFSIVMNEL